MGNYKKIGVIIFFSFIFSIIALYISRDTKDFIYVVPNIKNFEVLNPGFGKYSLEKLDLNSDNGEIKQLNILNGSIFYDVPNGEYKIIGEYFKDRDEIVLKKERDWEKVYLDLEGVRFTSIEEKFLVFLTLLLIVFNGYLYTKLQKKLPKKSILNYSFFLLTLKIFLSLRLIPSNNFILLLDFLVTRITLYLLIFYFLQRIFPKKLKKLKVLTYIILGVIYFYNVVIALIICSPQFLVYLLSEHREFLIILSFLRKNIDLSRVLFLLLAITFFFNRKKVKRENIVSWSVVWVSFFFLEFFREFFPVAENLNYFIDLMELFSIYWFFIFYTFKIYSRNVLRVILYSIAITLSYISLFYFKTMSESAIIIGIVILLDFYASTINKIMYVATPKIEHIYNRLCLISSIEEFEKLLAREIKKELTLESVSVKILIHKKDIKNYVDGDLDDNTIIPNELLKLKNYDYAYRIGFDKNREIALVFIKEEEVPLSLGEQNFLMELLSRSANIINKLRIEHLYREVR